jgi:hypothetical protein
MNRNSFRILTGRIKRIPLAFYSKAKIAVSTDCNRQQIYWSAMDNQLAARARFLYKATFSADGLN